MTAYRALFARGRVARGETVLITGVGGGVQTFVLLFAKHAGARTIVTSGSDEKFERARALGADVTVNYKKTPEWHKEVRNATGGGPDLIVDSVGGETLARALELRSTAAGSCFTAARPAMRRCAPILFFGNSSMCSEHRWAPGGFRCDARAL